MTPDQPPPPDTDTTGHQPYPSGVLARIVAIHFPEKIVGVAEQGLLRVNGSALALDTGETFGGVSTGATGRLVGSQIFTVLTSGIVVYGQPQQGDACFMACIDGYTVLRGHQDVGGDMEGIVWDPVYSSANGVSGLSFAGGGFFVVQYGSANLDSACAVSFDGENFSEIGNIYAGIPDIDPPHTSLVPGTVAFNGRSYAAAAWFFGTPNYPNVIQIDDFNMAWASSSEGTGWSVGYTPDEMSEPGANPYAIGGSIYTSIAGGNGLFVAAGTSRTTFQTTFPVPGTGGEEFSQYVYPTAAAVVSSDGNSWSAVNLPGATEASYAELGGGYYSSSDSVSSSVAFIRTGSGGYFVMSATGFSRSGAAPIEPASWCWKGSGSSWQLIKQASDFSLGGSLSAVAQNLSGTKIVQI